MATARFIVDLTTEEELPSKQKLQAMARDQHSYLHTVVIEGEFRDEDVETNRYPHFTAHIHDGVNGCRYCAEAVHDGRI